MLAFAAPLSKPNLRQPQAINVNAFFAQILGEDVGMDALVFLVYQRRHPPVGGVKGGVATTRAQITCN